MIRKDRARMAGRVAAGTNRDRAKLAEPDYSSGGPGRETAPCDASAAGLTADQVRISSLPDMHPPECAQERRPA